MPAAVCPDAVSFAPNRSICAYQKSLLLDTWLRRSTPQANAGRGVPERAAAFVPDRQPRRPDPGEQAVKVGQARERLPEFQPALGTQDAEQAAGVGERLPGGAGDPRIASAARVGARVNAARAPSERATMTVRWRATPSCISRAMRARSTAAARALVWSCSSR